MNTMLLVYQTDGVHRRTFQHPCIASKIKAYTFLNMRIQNQTKQKRSGTRVPTVPAMDSRGVPHCTNSARTCNPCEATPSCPEYEQNAKKGDLYPQDSGWVHRLCTAHLSGQHIPTAQWVSCALDRNGPLQIGTSYPMLVPFVIHSMRLSA